MTLRFDEVHLARLEALTLEHVMAMEDGELVDAGAALTRHLDVYKTLTNRIAGEVVRRALERKATRLMAGDHIAAIETRKTISWPDPVAVEELLKPYATPGELAKAVAHETVPARTVLKVDTRTARSIAKKAGVSVAVQLEELAEVSESAPSVKYEAIDLPFD